MMRLVDFTSCSLLFYLAVVQVLPFSSFVFVLFCLFVVGVFYHYSMRGEGGRAEPSRAVFQFYLSSHYHVYIVKDLSNCWGD